MNHRQRLTLLATIVGSGVVILDSTVVNLALPKIAASMHADFSDLQWIADGYLLSLSSLILMGGSLGDIFGRKKVYLTGLVGFGVVSLACGLAPNSLSLIIARIIQGIFGSLLVPGGLAIINTNFDKTQRALAISTWSAWAALIPPAGPIIGGFILNVASWRWVFLINLPLIAACYLLAKAGVVETKSAEQRHLDIQGAVLTFASLASITYGLIQGPVEHWRPITWMSLIIGVALLPLLIYAERRHPDPLIQLKLFRSRNFSISNIMTFLMYGGLGGFIFAFVIFLQTKVGYSSLRAGLSILPLPLCIFLFSKRFGALCAKTGPRPLMAVGPTVAGIGIAILYGLHAGQAYISHILPGLLLFGFGMSILIAPLTITVLGSVSSQQSGFASGINNAMSRVSGLIVVALLGLFGAQHQYQFAILLGAILALLAGIISYAGIDNKQITAD